MPAVLSKWDATLYGFAELDTIYDTTQSFFDLAGSTAVQRSDNSNYAGNHGRAMMGVRNSRLGFRINAPEVSGIRASALAEMDFLGNQPAQTPPAVASGSAGNLSEAGFFTSPGFRLRHMNLRLDNDYVDLLFGQTWQLFGWQSMFHPCTVEIQGVPGEVYSRAPQIRLSHTFKSSAVNVDLAIAIAKPPQRDAGLFDYQAGIKASINSWKGARTAGATGSSIDPLQIGVSAVGRRFVVPELASPPKADVTGNGWGVAVDLLLPIIPSDGTSRGNSLTFTGSFTKGEGINDLFQSLTGGVGVPTLPAPMGGGAAPAYTPGIDSGLVFVDAAGVHPIEWRAFILGLQYYFPGSGSVWVAANYSRLESNNSANFGAPTKIWNKEQWADGNLFWDVTPAVRLGAEVAWFNMTYADGTDATNIRGQFSAFYLF
jgi:hypothetical protein